MQLETWIALRIRQLCEERGWTVYQLMKNCPLSKNSVYNAANGHTHITIDSLYCICKGLGTSMEGFLQGLPENGSD